MTVCAPSPAAAVAAPDMRSEAGGGGVAAVATPVDGGVTGDGERMSASSASMYIAMGACMVEAAAAAAAAIPVAPAPAAAAPDGR